MRATLIDVSEGYITIMDIDVASFQDKILGFYKEHKREFPWRKTTNPYHIWVSETMLQQTQAVRVVPKYEVFIETFPTVDSLANAAFNEVLDIWTGLGYNNRAKWLRDGAKYVMQECNGTLPISREGLEKIKGIGPYTSHAIRIFAHNIDEVTVDTNIRRIFIHSFTLNEDVSNERLHDIAWKVLPKGKSRMWHNALMDYGALHATSSKTGISPRTKQSTFEGSNRWYRSKILQAVNEEPQTRDYFIDLFGQEAEAAITSLLEDGMLVEESELHLPS